MTNLNISEEHDNELSAVHTYVESSKPSLTTNNALASLQNIESKLKTGLETSTVKVGAQSAQLSNLNNIIDDKKQRLMRQEEEIEQKKKIVMTRNRMLNVVEQKNLYNRKIIYTLVSVIFGIFIIMLLVYVYYNKNYKSKTSNGSNTVKVTANINSVKNTNT
jgi:flagellar biosynthesis chaperone FliJ